ncbi:TP901-1 family phage major tail protein [Sporomusaceae bacterium BoRhaA]|uniref:phage tail tube protein n=1 Tax=Pelorhabdus rhamnosifermentans TaxID=2772457 RepID=UPI001C0601CF|nr:phage tail tube protein [Pelorhabdus rhamnosifermentans]MBU2703877.1 TP901-1 family phage major tail protein [Pelorhabdus rhamnosifermentans]
MDEFKFDLQRFGITLPEEPDSTEGTVGKDYLIYIAAIRDSKEFWALIGGQKSGTIDESADEVDVTTKTTGGNKATLPGLTSWSIDFDTVVVLPGSNDGIEALKIAKRQKKLVKIKVRYPDNSYQVGWATITSYSIETPSDGAATLKGKLSGNGPLSSESVTVSTADATDQIFYFDKKSLATSVKLDGAVVDAASYIATAEGQITFKGTYFATLPAGEHLFYVYLSTGGYALVAVTITSDVTITPTTATISKTSATDKAFTIAPSTETVSSVKNGVTALTSSTDYTYSSGTLTLKSAYLAALSTGIATLTVTTGSGASLTITITVTA